MMRTLAIASFAILFALSPPAYGDEKAEANRLFVQATKLATQAETASPPGRQAELREQVLMRLERIVDRYPGSDLAATLAAGDRVGSLSLPLARAEVELARLRSMGAAGQSAAAQAELKRLSARYEDLRSENLRLRELLDAEERRVTALLMEEARLRGQVGRAPVVQPAQPAKVATRQERVAPAAAAAVAPAPVPAPAPAPAPATVTQDEIAAAVRDALKVGTERVVAGLGRRDGFNGDPKVHIPLPANLAQVKSALAMVGMGGALDDVELKLNRAAEAAMPEAKEIFWQAITDMSFADIEGIFNGPDDSATQYFRSSMSGPLAEAMRPVVDQSLAQVGAIQAYNALTGKMSSNPLMPKVKADLTQHVLSRSVGSVFLYLAQEEAAIRNDSVKRTTALLQRVFGMQ
jgi:hypothetical protein